MILSAMLEVYPSGRTAPSRSLIPRSTGWVTGAVTRLDLLAQAITATHHVRIRPIVVVVVIVAMVVAAAGVVEDLVPEEVGAVVELPVALEALVVPPYLAVS